MWTTPSERRWKTSLSIEKMRQELQVESRDRAAEDEKEFRRTVVDLLWGIKRALER
jgi:hypothetical protein